MAGVEPRSREGSRVKGGCALSRRQVSGSVSAGLHSPVVTRRIELVPFDCAECGVRVVPGVDAAPWSRRFCSSAHSRKFYKRKWNAAQPMSERRRLARARLRSAGRGTRGTIGWIAGECRRCSRPFIARPTGGARPAAFCSDRCGLRERGSEAKYRRRARGASPNKVYRRQIFERDGWMCQLCGKKVMRGAVVPHPLAPTIDHVVPLAAGGLHEPANVQLAHFLCNARKSDRGEAD